MASVAQRLADFFLGSHLRVAQFRVGVKDGAAKAFHTICSMLPTYANNAAPSQLDLASPTVVVSLDAKNAFNAVSLAAVFNAITGVESSFYDDGEVGPGDRIPGLQCMRAFLPFIKTHYGRVEALGYASVDTQECIIVWGETGLQQGDPPASSLFSMALHPVVMLVLDSHLGFFAVVYMDNVYLVGQLEATLADAS
eukprot:3491874-Rhodomonas_salina.2